MAVTVRTAGKADIAAIDALLARSYPALLKADYRPSVLVTALPLISRAQPALVTCGTYFVVQDTAGTICGAGGWTRHASQGGSGSTVIGNIRHVVTDHRKTRQGIGRHLMAHILSDAAAAGITGLDCLSTLTAVPFYRAMGFVEQGPREISLRAGIVFPSVAMHRAL
jgi:N-acetylglutamate synthase-like GNAT family acetyltransferase